MKPDLARQLFSAIQRLTQQVDLLSQLNSDFLKPSATTQVIQPLLDQRELVLQDFQDTRRELDLLLEESGTGSPPFSLARVRDLAEAASPEGGEIVLRLRQALEALVDSDRKVQDRLGKEKIDLSESIRTLRKGSKAMKGYVQADPRGSCFIDKIK